MPVHPVVSCVGCSGLLIAADGESTARRSACVNGILARFGSPSTRSIIKNSPSWLSSPTIANRGVNPERLLAGWRYARQKVRWAEPAACVVYNNANHEQGRKSLGRMNTSLPAYLATRGPRTCARSCVSPWGRSGFASASASTRSAKGTMANRRLFPRGSSTLAAMPHTSTHQRGRRSRRIGGAELLLGRGLELHSNRQVSRSSPQRTALVGIPPNLAGCYPCDKGTGAALPVDRLAVHLPG